MTASVTGYSIIQGFASTLDTMLPSAWTSSQPQLVGLWSQRMGKSVYTPQLTSFLTCLSPSCCNVCDSLRMSPHLASYSLSLIILLANTGDLVQLGRNFAIIETRTRSRALSRPLP